MGATLRVDPERLRSAARAQADVGTFVSELAAGQSLTTAGSCVSGLVSAAACQFAATILDAAGTAVNEDLTAHSTNLSAAAEQYHQMDGELGRRLRKFAG